MDKIIAVDRRLVLYLFSFFLLSCLSITLTSSPQLEEFVNNKIDVPVR